MGVMNDDIFSLFSRARLIRLAVFFASTRLDLFMKILLYDTILLDSEASGGLHVHCMLFCCIQQVEWREKLGRLLSFFPLIVRLNNLFSLFISLFSFCTGWWH